MVHACLPNLLSGVAGSRARLSVTTANARIQATVEQAAIVCSNRKGICCNPTRIEHDMQLLDRQKEPHSATTGGFCSDLHRRIDLYLRPQTQDKPALRIYSKEVS